MNNQHEWKVVAKNKKNKKKPLSVIVEDDEPEIENKTPIKSELLPQPDLTIFTKEQSTPAEKVDSGSEVILPHKFVLWCHDIHSKDWSLNGYNKLCTITNVSEFWRLFNNLEKIGFKTNNFFIMKEGTDPTWEHANNRDGGICSFRTDIEHALKTYEDLCVRMMCSQLVDNADDINGVSLSPKNNWAIIKIWNKNKKNDLSKTLKPHILYTYKDMSIKYKENAPEY